MIINNKIFFRIILVASISVATACKTTSVSSKTNNNKRPKTNQNDSTKATRRLMRAAIQSVYSGLLDSRSFKEISAKSTRSSGLENGLITYDELHHVQHWRDLEIYFHLLRPGFSFLNYSGR